MRRLNIAGNARAEPGFESKGKAATPDNYLEEAEKLIDKARIYQKRI